MPAALAVLTAHDADAAHVKVAVVQPRQQQLQPAGAGAALLAVALYVAAASLLGAYAHAPCCAPALFHVHAPALALRALAPVHVLVAPARAVLVRGLLRPALALCSMAVPRLVGKVLLGDQVLLWRRVYNKEKVIVISCANQPDSTVNCQRCTKHSIVIGQFLPSPRFVKSRWILR